MYFLNGDTFYIKPDRCSASFEDQLDSCLRKMEKPGKRIFKLNFFAGVSVNDNYAALHDRLKKKVWDYFGDSLIFSLVAQPPIDCSILAEVFYFDDTLWNEHFVSNETSAAVLFERHGTEVLTGHVQSYSYKGCRQNSEAVFESLAKLLKKTGFEFNHIIRQWNYIDSILAYDHSEQRYQEFNDVRSSFYQDSFTEKGYPAATGIGMNCGGVIIEFVALKSADAVCLPVNNPEQVAAYGYSKDVLVGSNDKTTPKFERARYLELFGRKQLLISGTASIRGEKTVGSGNPEEQTVVTIQNMQRLYCTDVLKSTAGAVLHPVYGHARIYLRNRNDYKLVKKNFRSYYGNLPVVYLVADICRNNLLVEIEGKVILE
jgi:enamine deaminase RidA (YjgF/YER057c/UK114 family)